MADGGLACPVADTPPAPVDVPSTGHVHARAVTLGAGLGRAHVFPSTANATAPSPHRKEFSAGGELSGMTSCIVVSLSHVVQGHE